MSAPSSLASVLRLETLAAVRRPLGEAVGLPRAAYDAPEVFAHETEHLFLPRFLPVARHNDPALRDPGGRRVVSVLGDELLLVRGVDLALRVFFNVCRHRGSLLVRPSDPPRGSDIVCPYHGHRYDLRGAPIGGSDRTPTSCPGPRDDALIEGVVATFGGFVWVRSPARGTQNPADAARSLERDLGPIPTEIASLHLGSLAPIHHEGWEIQANWKLVVENFLESHHYPLVHPSLEAQTPHALAETLPDPAPWNGGLTILAQDVETVSRSGTRHGRRFLPGLAEEERDRVRDYHLWPLVLCSRQPDYLLVYRLDPLAPHRTQVWFSVLQHPASPVDSASVDDLVAFWRQTNDEDRVAIERQQRGVSSRGYRPGLLSPLEDGLHRFLVEVADFYQQSGTRPGD